MKRHVIFGIIASLTLVAPTTAQPPGSNSLAEHSPQEMIDVDVHVVDDFDRPVKGASVQLLWLSGANGDSAHDAPVKITDARGIAKIRCRKMINREVPTTGIRCSVEHPKFINGGGERPIVNNQVEIRLKRGIRISTKAINGETNEQIHQNLFGTLGYQTMSLRWQVGRSGEITSPMFDLGRHSFRLVHVAYDGSTWFSGVVPAFLSSKRTPVRVPKTIPLFPGNRLTGTVDASVPRPIKNGQAIVQVYGIPSKQRTGGGYPYDVWVDRTPINSDGTFLFESLPPSDQAEIVVMADGFVSKVIEPNPHPEVGVKYRVMGGLQPRRVSVSDRTQEVHVPMEKTASLTVQLSSSDGNPIAGAEVRVYCNYQWHGVGGDLTRTDFRTLEALQGKHRYEYRWVTGTTSDEGRVTIDNLFGSSYSLEVFHSDFEMRPNLITPYIRDLDVQLESGKTKMLNLTLEPVGTTPLDLDPANATPQGIDPFG